MPPIVYEYPQSKCLRVSTRQSGLQTSTGPPDLHTSTRYTGLLEFRERTDLQTSIARIG